MTSTNIVKTSKDAKQVHFTENVRKLAYHDWDMPVVRPSQVLEWLTLVGSRELQEFLYFDERMRATKGQDGFYSLAREEGLTWPEDIALRILGFPIRKNADTLRLQSECGTVQVWQQGMGIDAPWVIHAPSLCLSVSAQGLDASEAKAIEHLLTLRNTCTKILKEVGHL